MSCLPKARADTCAGAKRERSRRNGIKAPGQRFVCGIRAALTEKLTETGELPWQKQSNSVAPACGARWREKPHYPPLGNQDQV